MTCKKGCGCDECGAQKAMDKAFADGRDDCDRLIYNNIGFSEQPIGSDLKTVERLALDLPDVDYILDSIVYYMFTNKITTSDPSKDEEWDKFFAKKNFNGQRNIDVLQGVAKGYRKYGYYGLLSLGNKGGIVGVHPSRIDALQIQYPDHPVLNQTKAYVIYRSDNKSLDTPFNRVVDRVTGNSMTTSVSIKDFKEYLKDPIKTEKEKGYLIVTDKEFSCIRLDTARVFGISPLLKDRKRIKLVIDILDRMDYDIVRNGIGTIALKARDTVRDKLVDQAEEGVMPSAGQLMDMGRSAKEERASEVAKDMEDISDKLSNVEFNDAIVYSSNFEDLVQLNRDTKASDFLDYLSLYVPSIIAQMFGVPARLFDLGKTVSNIGTHSIIDNAMRNNIIPQREHFLGQCLDVLQHASGLTDELTFASYEFTRDYNYENDLKILEAYNQIKEFDQEKAEAYLKRNLII